MIDKNYYMTEACGYFALALNELFGYQIQILIDDVEQEEYDQPVVAHVFCITKNNEAIDVNGKQNSSDIKKNYFDLEYPKIINVSPEELKFEWMGDDKPLFSYNKQEVENAKEIILNNQKDFFYKTAKSKIKGTHKDKDGITYKDDSDEFILFKNYDLYEGDSTGPGVSPYTEMSNKSKRKKVLAQLKKKIDEI